MSGQLSTQRGGRGGGCHCCERCRRAAARAATLEQEGAIGSVAAPVWVNALFKLYRAGRLGWKAGRWIDKQTGRRFGKSISDRGADFLYQRLGRSRAAEDFFDRLPVRVKRWLNQL